MTSAPAAPSNAIVPHAQALARVFHETRDKYRAHERSREILAEMADDSSVLATALEQHIARPSFLNQTNYPVVSLDLHASPHFTLVANCWIPLPGGETNISTKSIHHHGTMLLSTITAFGPGYEHWTFTRPRTVDAERELYDMKVVERGPHPRGHIAFVNAYLGHVPIYPPSLTITFALWTNSRPTTWKDYVKRIPALERRAEVLRRVAARAGLANQLDLKIIDYFDFYPTPAGFKGMRDRIEFERGPNADFLYSFFHVLQKTGNEQLARAVRKRLETRPRLHDPTLVRSLSDDLSSGRPIPGRLSDVHYGIPHANFTTSDIERALAASAP